MEIESRVPVPGERVDESLRNLDDIDVEEILNRPRRRGQFRRQKACLNKAPEFVKRLNAFEEAKAGSTVVFESTWQAFPRAAIKWYKDDEEVVENNRFRKEDSQDGTSRLHIDNCRKQDEGAYKCKAENSEGVASTTGYLSVAGDIKEKKLASQPRKNCQHAVSHPPMLLAITEQKSLELREEEEFKKMPPSPINDDIENLLKEKLFHKKTSSPPTTPDTDDPKKVADTEEDDSGSDTSCDSQDFDRVPTHDPEEEERERTPELEFEKDLPEGQPEKAEVNQKESGPCPQQGSQLYMVIKPDGRLEEVPIPVPRQTPPPSPEVMLQPIKLCPNYISFQSAPSVEQQGNISYTTMSVTPEKSEILAQFKHTDSSVSIDTSTNEYILEFPWLLFLAFSSVGTFVASATELSPFWYVVSLAVLSLLSFRFLVTTKPSCS